MRYNLPAGQITATPPKTLKPDSEFDARLDGDDFGKAPARLIKCIKAGTLTLGLLDTPTNTFEWEVKAGDEVDYFQSVYIETDSTAEVRIFG